MKKYLIVVAGGTGSRMKSATPKQFLILGNEPLLMHTIKAFYNFNSSIIIILALPRDYFSYWIELCSEYDFKINHQLTEGGENRFHSVKNALETIHETGLVAIHDGVRPLVSKNTITACFKVAEDKGNAIPVIDIQDSVRIVDEKLSKPVNRDNYKLVQTPQVFDIDLIKKAYHQTYKEHFTDDASLLDEMGIQLNLVEGNRENIKITTSTDLNIANALI